MKVEVMNNKTRRCLRLMALCIGNYGDMVLMVLSYPET